MAVVVAVSAELSVVFLLFACAFVLFLFFLFSSVRWCWLCGGHTSSFAVQNFFTGQSSGFFDLRKAFLLGLEG